MSALTEEIAKGKDSIMAAWEKSATALKGPSPFPVRKGQGRFANPAAYHREEGMSDVLDWLCADEVEEIPASLGDICRIKAVQDDKPSQSLAFLFDLKNIIRSVVGNAATEAEYRALDEQIDALALHSFDYFVACRNQIAQLRVEEVSRGEKMLLRRLEKLENKEMNGENLA